MSEKDSLAEMETLFLALSDKTRLRIINLMREGEVCVQYFTDILGESQPKVSRHLAYLRSAGIVSARRDGKWIYYRLKIPQNPPATDLLYKTLDWLGAQAAMRAEYEKLPFSGKVSSEKSASANSATENIFAETYAMPPAKEELDVFLL